MDIMVFCYKIITDSPRRSHCASPRKGRVGRFPGKFVFVFINVFRFKNDKHRQRHPVGIKEVYFDPDDDLQTSM